MKLTFVPQFGGGTVPATTDRLCHGRGRTPLQSFGSNQLPNIDAYSGYHRVRHCCGYLTSIREMDEFDLMVSLYFSHVRLSVQPARSC